jgi:hypothetical protein
MKISDAQRDALKSFAKACTSSGHCHCPEGVRLRTLSSLLKKGLVEVAHSTEPEWRTEIVSNQFGRGWHTRGQIHCIILYRLTEAGKDAVKS